MHKSETVCRLFLLFLQLSLVNGRKRFRDNQSNIYYSITDAPPPLSPSPIPLQCISSLFKVKPTAVAVKLCQWNYYCKCIIDFSSLLSLLFATWRELFCLKEMFKIPINTCLVFILPIHSYLAFYVSLLK